ncbi:MAG: helix-turn-helix domain-containing protein [Thermoflexales bacterium]|nr:helix-turn-helix domain-containing protein [Thermoflexales bacterium]
MTVIQRVNYTHCNSPHLTRYGKNDDSNTPRYQCKDRYRFHTPNPKPRGYPPELRQQALVLAVNGHSKRSIAQTLNINHQTAANWVKEGEQR